MLVANPNQNIRNDVPSFLYNYLILRTVFPYQGDILFEDRISTLELSDAI